MAERGGIGCPAEVERHLRRAGLTELCPRGHERSLWAAYLIWLGPIAAAIGIAFVPTNGSGTWQDAVVTAGVLACFVVEAVMAANACARARWAHGWRRLFQWAVIIGLGAGVLTLVLLVNAWGLVGEHHPGEPIKAYDLALGLLAVTAYVVGASGGLALARAVLAKACHVGSRDLRAGVAATPEILFLVAFVIVVGDVWKTLAPMDGWRVEVLLLGCVGGCAIALTVRSWASLRTLWKIDVEAAVMAARRRGDTAALSHGSPYESLPRTMTLPRHARWNVALIVVLPVLIRLLIAGVLMTAVLFAIGVVILDEHRLIELLTPAQSPLPKAPPVPVPAAAVKVAAILSGLATSVIALTDTRGVLRRMAERRTSYVLADLGVWAAHLEPDRAHPAPSAPVTEVGGASAPVPAVT